MKNTKTNYITEATWTTIAIAYLYLCAYSMQNGWLEYFGVSYRYLSIVSLAVLWDSVDNYGPIIALVLALSLFVVLPTKLNNIGIVYRIAIVISAYAIANITQMDIAGGYFVLYFSALVLAYYARMTFELENSIIIDNFFRLIKAYHRKKRSIKSRIQNRNTIKNNNLIIMNLIKKIPYVNFYYQIKRSKKNLNTHTKKTTNKQSRLLKGRKLVVSVELIIAALCSIHFFEKYGQAIAQNTDYFLTCPTLKFNSVLVGFSNDMAICVEYDPSNLTLLGSLHYTKIPSSPTSLHLIGKDFPAGLYRKQQNES